MPTPVQQDRVAGASASAPIPSNLVPISNTYDAMTAPGFGPEQADIEVISSEYVEFDYNGNIPEPVIAVKWNCRPLGGENDNKDFVIEWPCGPKAHDFAIINDGGALAAIGSKQTLTNTSNWALAQKSMVDAGLVQASLDAPDGIRYFVGAQMTLRRVPQPQRTGMDEKNTKGYIKEYYTCLKILSLPGEKKATKPRAAAPRATATATAPRPTATTAPAAAPAATPAPAPANGVDLLGLISQALANNGGSLEISVPGLSTPVYHAAKAAGIGARDCHSAGTQALALVSNEDSFYAAIGEAGLSWQINEGRLVG